MRRTDSTCSQTTLILTAEDVVEIINRCGRGKFMDQMIAALTEAFEQPADNLTLRPRQGFNWKQPSLGLLEWMPILEQQHSATIKVVAYVPDNPTRRSLPTVVGTVSLYDAASGHLAALADGVLLTALRTGAASAVASRLLVQPRANTLGMIGCGMQAVTQLHALSRVLSVERVLIHDIDHRLETSFPDRVAFLGLEVSPAPRERIERRADVLCTTTSVGVGDGPVLSGEALQPHVHINAVGSDFPGKIEVPKAVLERSLVCPDFREQAIREGECQQLTGEQIGPELSELVREPERFATWREQSTVFDSTGSALEDHAAMRLLVDLATELGVGTSVRLEHHPVDAYDPYAPASPTAEREGEPEVPSVADPELVSVSA